MKKRLDTGEKSRDSKEEATRWMARKMSGAMNEKEIDEFERWLNESEDNIREFGELENLMMAVDADGEALLAGEFERELNGRESSRARVSRIGVAFVAVAGVVIVGFYFLRSL